MIVLGCAAAPREIGAKRNRELCAPQSPTIQINLEINSIISCGKPTAPGSVSAGRLEPVARPLADDVTKPRRVDVRSGDGKALGRRHVENLPPRFHRLV